MTTIHATVMRRVRTIHLLRAMALPALASLALFMISLWAIGREVWVANVFRNMPSPAHLLAFARFFLSAFLTTEAIVQLATVLALVAGVALLRAIVRTLSAFTRFA